MNLNLKPVFEVNENISTENFSMVEINKAIKQMKLNKAPDLDSLPLDIWKLPKCKEPKCNETLLSFCNSTMNGIRPVEWGLSAIVPVSKKGDLTKADNYRVNYSVKSRINFTIA